MEKMKEGEESVIRMQEQDKHKEKERGKEGGRKWREERGKQGSGIKVNGEKRLITLKETIFCLSLQEEFKVSIFK